MNKLIHFKDTFKLRFQVLTFFKGTFF